MSDFFFPLWNALEEIDREISAAIEMNHHELANLRAGVQIRLQVAEHMDLPRVQERLNGLIHLLDSLELLQGKAGSENAKNLEPDDVPPPELSEAAMPIRELFEVSEFSQPDSPSSEEDLEVGEYENGLAEKLETETVGASAIETPTLNLPKLTPARKAPGQAKKKEFQKKQSAFFAAERALPNPENKRSYQFQVASLICRARGLRSQANEFDLSGDQLQISIDNLARLVQGEFFGLNFSRSHSESQWSDLSDAYQFLIDCDRAIAWLDENQPSSSDRKELIDMMGAANAYLPRLKFDYGYNFRDQRQESQKNDIDTLNNRQNFIPWFQFNGEAPSISRLKTRASELKTWIERAEQRQQQASTRDVAKSKLAALVEAIEGDSNPDDFIADLRCLVADCLNCGVRPTDINFKRSVLPYRHHLGELESSHGRRLEEELRKLENHFIAKKEQVVETDSEDEPSPVVEALRSQLKGNTVLMIGGRSDRSRVKALADALGCDVEWPDSHEATKIEDFRAAVDRADIVCRFIRWSRHGYKEVLDWATEQGKPTVTFKAGSGVNRVVHDMVSQLRLTVS